MIDAGLVWDAKTAIQRARAFSDSKIFWLEEPLEPDDYEGYSQAFRGDGRPHRRRRRRK